MKILLPYIKKINILTFLLLLILFPLQAKSENLSIFTETPIIVNPESELEGFLIDLILDKMVYHYYKIPKAGVKKHNSTLSIKEGIKDYLSSPEQIRTARTPKRPSERFASQKRYISNL